jgi:ribonuclease HI
VRGHSGHPENERADAIARARIAEESWGKRPSALTRG